MRLQVGFFGNGIRSVVQLLQILNQVGFVLIKS